MEKMVIDPYSKEKAETSYKVIDYKKGLSLLEVYPKTGRKHQIRVHLRSINHPILGDYKYNSTNNDNKEECKAIPSSTSIALFLTKKAATGTIKTATK